jgi:hypothetical protein
LIDRAFTFDGSWGTVLSTQNSLLPELMLKVNDIANQINTIKITESSSADTDLIFNQGYKATLDCSKH